MKKLIVVFILLSSFLIVPMLMLFLIISDNDSQKYDEGSLWTIGLSAEVLAYKPLVEEYANKYGISDYVSYLLAIMQVESGGTGTDPMQSSESAGLPVNTLTPEASIEQGCKHFANCLSIANSKGCDIDTVVQSYNYGSGFVNYVASNGNAYTFDLAVAFAKDNSGGKIKTYSNPIADAYGNWRYGYGNMFYVPLVKQYLTVGSVTGEFGNAVMHEALKYEGYPYTWGGTAPYSFDCSALTQWCYSVAGVSIPRTAQEQYNSMSHISLADAQVGDLIFFHSTSNANGNYITHVGIYVGDGRMFHAGNNGVEYTSIETSYYQSHFACFGTVR